MINRFYRKSMVFAIAVFFIGIANASSIITSELNEKSIFRSSEEYKLVIITPFEFYENLEPLATHKNSIGMETNIVTLDSIYDFFNGRDTAEKIKYFIKFGIEEWNISYVLLVGDIYKLPIRKSYASLWDEDILSDQYYADIYDENDSFCSWDANENDRFGEVECINCSDFPMDGYESYEKVKKTFDIDGVDLIPDVMVGRLPCSNYKEVDIVVNKIINYEIQQCNSKWFEKIILVGGDDKPQFEGNEGEIATEEVAKQLPDFEHIYLWTSKNTFNAYRFNRAINKGAGFVSYSGIALEFILGTFTPNDTDSYLIKYYPIFIRLLRNKNKLPIIFFDACRSAGLDFKLNNLTSYESWEIFKLLTLLPGIDENTPVPCIAWKFVKEKGGGAIATIGSTRVSYSLENLSGMYAGAGVLMVQFFKSYKEGITLGEMFTQAQKEYINILLPDYLTIEEFILLGDPSLRVGGL